MNNMRRGFTMIELIFVIVIIGILAAVAIPKMAATTTNARASNLKATIATVSSAVPSYYLGQKVASMKAASTIDGDWVFADADCTATYTDAAGDTVSMQIQNNNAVSTVSCSDTPEVVNNAETNLSLLITLTVAGTDAVNELQSSLNVPTTTRIPLGSKSVLRQ